MEEAKGQKREEAGEAGRWNGTALGYSHCLPLSLVLQVLPGSPRNSDPQGSW